MAGAVGIGWAWSQGQYFVGTTETEDGDVVAVFRGLTQDVGPLRLSTVDETTDVAVADLPFFQRGIVTEGIQADDRDEAMQIVEDLRSQLLTGQESG
jgi:protein phosphatase